MVRVRKGKGASSAPAPTESSGKAKSAQKSRSGDAVLQEQVLALGGTKADLDLVKNVKQTTTDGSLESDPTLSKDVSQFLKGLNLGGHDGSEETAKPSKAPKKNKKPLAKPDTPKASSPKKKAAVSKTANVSASAAPASVEAKQSKRNARGDSKATSGSAPTPPSKKKEAFKLDAPADVPAAVEEPKVQLPSKVTLDPKSKFIISPASHWYLSAPSLGAASASLPAVNATQLASLTTRASNLHTTDIQTFQTSSSSNSSASEANFLSKIIQSGTLSDRLSALTLLVQSSPLHNTKALETLKSMAEHGKGKGGREESLKALRCVVDWWVGGGAPDRKLKYMRDQPLSHPSVTDQHLLLWYFEDWLKKYFFSILQILETLSLDPLPYVRTQTLTLMATLLRDKPEQEQNLLRLLVNKLGDTEKSICSRASHQLLQLLQSHPSMKAVIVREIIALVLRPPAPPPAPAPTTANKHIRFTDDPKPKPKPKPEEKEKKPAGNVHARYYATITFNQIVLSPGDRDVALQLIDVYFELFKELLGEGNTSDGDGDDAEAEGADKDKKPAEVKTDKGGRVRDGGKGKGKGKGKAIEVKGAAGFTEVEDAHSKLISAILTGVNRALPFAKIEAGDVGLNKHIDTLFLITHTSTFNISLQALVLIQQISASLAPPSASASSSSTPTSKSITDRYYRTLYSSLHDNRLATSSKQAMYLNLLFKSLKADVGNTERVKAIVRRFVQVLVSGGSGATEFIAGGLFLLGELFSSTPGLRSMLNDPEDSEGEDYDPRKRDPQYAHASSSPLWELTPLLHHYHPAISLHARQLLSSQPLTASADLSLNTISHFLDRFVYKNPKKVKPNANNANVVVGKGKGASAMQPAASGLEGGGVKLMKGEMGVLEERVNEGGFLKRKEADVPVDQLFFHKFFSRKSEKEKAMFSKGRKNRDEDSDSGDEDEEKDDDEEGNESGEEMDLTGDEAKDAEEAASEFEEEDSDIGEDEIWKAMQASMPQAGGDDEDLMEESDELPSDLDEGDDASDDDDDALSLVEASDNEDLVSLDANFPGLIDYDGSDEEAGGEDEEEWGGITQGGDKKRKREDSSNQKRKKLRSLPTFASYEDYAKMIEDGPEDDI
ncbi:CBF/Mak21 family-domain-containing protein [Mycena albidolilacea]|uniref:CBF/Mak21 family-domain-containing protein n=1 Tax=Mycena albidolilacea TaxID=1033008 RepID=A0AAD7A3X8_9AGAR|nr:CBF/Mak21 family-domain-containing protein [Mycena albidolilacea]